VTSPSPTAQPPSPGEQLTGWAIAECEDLDSALQLATTIPAAWHGSIEVRPAGATPI